MKISALIPAYNCAKTIQATLDSVLRQSTPPDEILVMNDGSTDATAAILEGYGTRIRVFWQPNGGLASARNALLARASGDLMAFLDSDDVWHPRYLEIQKALFEKYPQAVAFFTWHINFRGSGDYIWNTEPNWDDPGVEVISGLDFFKRYNEATGPFLADCCIPAAALRQLGSEPYREMGAEDSYCFSLLALLGPVVYTSLPVVARRMRDDSLSSNHLWTFGVWVHVFEVLASRYENLENPEFIRAFRHAFASKRRSYAKILMGAGKTAEARKQLQVSLTNCLGIRSLCKSGVLLGLTYLPSSLQPSWPSGVQTCEAEELQVPERISANENA